jgi:hypothetical protein
MLDRETILKKVNEEIPEFYNFLNQCYQKPSNLYYGSTVILSQRGVQQGDPLGPPLFGLGIQSMINSLCSELNIWYMDDGTLISDQENVFQDLESIISRSKDIGLELNFSKCELAVTSNDTEERNKILEQFNFIAPGIKLLKQENTYILGCPLSDTGLSKELEKRTSELDNMTTRMCHLPSHMAFYLMQRAFSVPKMNHLLRYTLLAFQTGTKTI